MAANNSPTVFGGLVIVEAAGVRLGERPHQAAGLGHVPPAGQRQFGAQRAL